MLAPKNAVDMNIQNPFCFCSADGAASVAVGRLSYTFGLS